MGDSTDRTRDRPAVRADAQRNLDALLVAADDLFREKGVGVPVREIAARAGVGVGTFYRHFPLRSDLVVAVMHRDVDDLVDAARELAATLTPLDALTEWMLRYTRFVGTKIGLHDALLSGEPAYAPLAGYFESNAVPELAALMDAAARAGDIRGDLDPLELVRATSDLTRPGEPEHTRRMIALLVDGMRFGARAD